MGKSRLVLGLLARFVSRSLFNPLSRHREWPSSIFSQQYYSKVPKSVTCFWFIHILSYRFNPIRSQLETVLDFWLVNVCMKECELIKGGHTFGLLAVMPNQKNRLWGLKQWSLKVNALIFYQILSTNSLKKTCGDQSGEFKCGYWGWRS